MTAVLFRHQQELALPGTPVHVLTALGSALTGSITRAELDAILDVWVWQTGGTTHNVTSHATFDSATAAALPGDLVRVTSAFTATGALVVRGSLYSISGTTLTASPAGGSIGLPIVYTCADGVEVTGSSLTNNVGTLDFLNCRHVWAVGFNINGSTQFGIRTLNAGGTAAHPAYIAYCDINGCRDATIATQGWFQLITTSGGTPPAGGGNTWGYSEYIVIEENDCIDPNPTEVAGNPGEGIYLGRGASPGWVSYSRYIWVRGNRVRQYRANGIEVKPGCHHIWIYDNDIEWGRGQNGAPLELCYQFSGTGTRPAEWNDIDGSGSGDIHVYAFFNRIWDFNISETGTTRNQCILLGMAGVRIGFNVVWAVRDSAGLTTNIAGVLIQSEKPLSDFGDTSTQPTMIINNLLWCNAVSNLGASDGAITGVIQRNNIVPTGFTGGQFTADVTDFVGPVPTPGTLTDAQQATGDPGSGFELLETSALWGAGSSLADLILPFSVDPFGRTIPMAGLNPGPFMSGAADVITGGATPVSRFVAYTNAAKPGPNQNLVIDTVVDLIDPTGQLLCTTDLTRAGNGVFLWNVAGAALQLDPDRTLSRTVDVDVACGQTSLVPIEAGSLLHPESGNQVKIAAGLHGSSMWTLATLLIEDTQVESVADTVMSVKVSLVDPGRPVRSDLVNAFPWDAGEPVEDVVARLLAIVVDEVDLAQTGYTMPAAGSFPPGRSIAQIVQQLLGGCGHELTADEDGRLFSRPVPPTKADDSEVWAYGGSGRLPWSRAKRRWSVRSPQGVLVTGGSLLTPGTTYSVPVWDTDPDSEGFFNGPGEVQVEEVTYEHVGTPNQSVVAGYALLRRLGSGPAIVDLEIAPNPAMRPGDLVDLRADSIASTGLYRVRYIGALPTIPDRPQQVTLRAVWDPELGYTHPAAPGLACVSIATDSFDRPDQNLEDQETSPGSPLWTELAYSWGIVGQKAIQRHNGTASLARWNTPMCGIDYIIYMTLADVPPGKWIGPAGRSSGQFDCYCAVIDADGRIRIEMWLAGKKVAELGSYVTNTDDPSGKQLDLICDSSRLTAVWEGTEVLSVTDTRRTGPYVGMHALGGVSGSTAPGANSWTAELL
jgi:hypothetical protein